MNARRTDLDFGALSVPAITLFSDKNFAVQFLSLDIFWWMTRSSIPAPTICSWSNQTLPFKSTDNQPRFPNRNLLWDVLDGCILSSSTTCFISQKFCILLLILLRHDLSLGMLLMLMNCCRRTSHLGFIFWLIAWHLQTMHSTRSPYSGPRSSCCQMC